MPTITVFTLQNQTTPATIPTVKPSILLARCLAAVFERSINDPSFEPLLPASAEVVGPTMPLVVVAVTLVCDTVGATVSAV